MDQLLSFSAFSVFLAIAAVGFLFLILSLFFGEIFEHFDGGLDHEFDHGFLDRLIHWVVAVSIDRVWNAGLAITPLMNAESL